jgi:hypothetical protein
MTETCLFRTLPRERIQPEEKENDTPLVTPYLEIIYFGKLELTRAGEPYCAAEYDRSGWEYYFPGKLNTNQSRLKIRVIKRNCHG